MSRSDAKPPRVVELTRAPRFEAETIIAHLRASGIEATLGADAVYASLSFADGVPIYVSADDLETARAIIEPNAQPD
jgi:hypothetical protein